MFGRGDEAGGNGDVTFFFTAQRPTVLKFDAFGILGVRFRTGGIIDSQDRLGRRTGGDLAVQDF